MSCPRCQHSHFVKNGFINENSVTSVKTVSINGQKTGHIEVDPLQRKHFQFSLLPWETFYERHRKMLDAFPLNNP